VHDVEAPAADIGSEALPDLAFEIGIDQPLERRGHGPALAASHPQERGQPVHRRRKRLGVDGGEVPALDEARAQDRLAIADLRDDMDIRHLAQGRGHRPADKRHADPFGIGRLGHHQYGRTGHHQAPWKCRISAA
jgi:hypothetical protein